MALETPESALGALQALSGGSVTTASDAAALADAYETVCGLVLAGGREVRGRAIDLMIAATAAAHGAAVITRNPDDFAGLDGLIPVIRA